RLLFWLSRICWNGECGAANSPWGRRSHTGAIERRSAIGRTFPVSIVYPLKRISLLLVSALCSADFSRHPISIFFYFCFVYLIYLSALYNTDCLCFGMEAKSMAQRCNAYEVFPFVFMLSLF